ncbi:AraC family transcriptional regulator [Solimonas sp. K1W22B-7]|uniref:AraC family transcriptional regulator n=1 Tax=Solimonas sp. K1W22B-7 TaxID=2303331 RepID=UPI000E330889|nr:AraC family transcriptional regulator [Solimonas sp. K1W22B-7]AXQ31310.1 AraC family transcriptional regulator [Solimonas sp. K1W22B-7]
MPYEQVRRSVVSVQLLVQLAAEHGLQAAAALEGSGIGTGVLADPQQEITAAQELRVAGNLVEALGHIPGLGLEAGLRYHLSAYGIWGFALLSSPTFRSAADIALRYLDLSYAFVRFGLREQRGQLQVLMDDRDIPPDTRRFLLERDFAAFINMVRELRPGGLPVLGAQFAFRRPAYAGRYREMLGAEPLFDAAENSVWLDAAYVDAPLPQGNTVMARMCLEQCSQLLARRQVRTGVAGKVRDRLLRNPGEMPGIETVAEEMHMAVRSLRRRLVEEDTSFRALVDEVRQALAEELLTTAKLKLEEVAYRLGYSEPAAFVHAFKRWKGISPMAYRAQRLG